VRITGGIAKGHTLKGPKPHLRTLRPTTDRVREAVFNILADRVVGARVLDLFAGTGSYGIEALSRRAQSVVFVDRDRTALELIARNLGRCFPDAPARAFQLDLTRSSSLGYLKNQLPDTASFDLIFIDPPYEKRLAQKLLNMVEGAGLLAKDGILLVEEKHNQHLPERVGKLELKDSRRYGKTGIRLYGTQPG